MKNLFSLMVTSLLVLGCASNEGERDEYGKTKKGAGIGAAIGAVAGAIVAKDKKQGAILGGVVGGIAGGAYGKKLDKQAKELEEVAETQRTDQGIITKLKGDITFETGKANVRNTAEERIQKMADILKKYPENRITVIGHTDSTGSDYINKDLSENRAESVKDLLVRNGVSRSSIVTMGVADRDPVATNNTMEGRQANRRVELAITMGEPEEGTKAE